MAKRYMLPPNNIGWVCKWLLGCVVVIGLTACGDVVVDGSWGRVTSDFFVAMPPDRVVEPGTKTVELLPRDMAIAFLKDSASSSRTGYECGVTTEGLYVPTRINGLGSASLIPYTRVVAQTEFVSPTRHFKGKTDSDTLLALVAKDTAEEAMWCLVQTMDPPRGTHVRAEPDVNMKKAVEALLSLGGKYMPPPNFFRSVRHLG